MLVSFRELSSSDDGDPEREWCIRRVGRGWRRSKLRPGGNRESAFSLQSSTRVTRPRLRRVLSRSHSLRRYLVNRMSTARSPGSLRLATRYLTSTMLSLQAVSRPSLRARGPAITPQLLCLPTLEISTPSYATPLHARLYIRKYLPVFHCIVDPLGNPGPHSSSATFQNASRSTLQPHHLPSRYINRAALTRGHLLADPALPHILSTQRVDLYHHQPPGASLHGYRLSRR